MNATLTLGPRPALTVRPVTETLDMLTGMICDSRAAAGITAERLSVFARLEEAEELLARNEPRDVDGYHMEADMVIACGIACGSPAAGYALAESLAAFLDSPADGSALATPAQGIR